MIYLDNAATTYPKPEEVYKAMDFVNRNLAMNPGRGGYSKAKEAENIIDETRNKLLKLAGGSDNYNVVLTPSATIALNEVIMGLSFREGENVYVSAFEHNAVMRTLHAAEKIYGFNVVELPLNEDLTMDIEKTKYMFSKDIPGKVFACHVSNVTGYILPVNEIANLAKEYEATVVVDASQSLGLVPIDLGQTHIDYMVFAGHKTLYGPLGIGGFFIKCGNNLRKYISGGTGTDSLNLEMPDKGIKGYEPASFNVVAAAGLNAALDEIKDNEAVETLFLREKELENYLAKELEKIHNVKLYVTGNVNSVGIVPFNIEGYKASETGMILDVDYDVAVRTGYHCAPLIHKHLKDTDYLGVVRASIGKFTTKEEIDGFVKAVRDIAEEY